MCGWGFSVSGYRWRLASPGSRWGIDRAVRHWSNRHCVTLGSKTGTCPLGNPWRSDNHWRTTRLPDFACADWLGAGRRLRPHRRDSFDYSGRLGNLCRAAALSVANSRWLEPLQPRLCDRLRVRPWIVGPIRVEMRISIGSRWMPPSRLVNRVARQPAEFTSAFP